MRLLGSKRLLRFEKRPSADSAPAEGPASEVLRLPVPVGRGLPERRSNHQDLGDLKTGKLHLLLGTPSGSGFPVNETTALNVAAVTACVGLIADMVAKLPIYLYRRTPKGPEEVTDHPAIRLISGIPSDLHTSFELRQLMETGKGLGGNGYARVFRTSTYEPRAIQWLAPGDVEPRRITRPNGESFVTYKLAGSEDVLTRSDIIHVRWLTRNGIDGLSPISLLRESIGTALSQTHAAGKLMRNGTNFPGFLKSDQVLPPDKVKDTREDWDRNYSGAAAAGRIPILNGNWSFQQTSGMSMVDAQFLESRRFELQEIARLYRIPAFLIGDTTSSTTWGSGIEQQTLGFLNFCLDPHLVAWEQSLAMTLLTTEEIRDGFEFKFDRDELANVALEARANFYQTMRNIGVYSPDDVRAKLGEPLLGPGIGDNYGQPFNSSGGSPAPLTAPSTLTEA